MFLYAVDIVFKGDWLIQGWFIEETDCDFDIVEMEVDEGLGVKGKFGNGCTHLIELKFNYERLTNKHF